MNCEQFGCVLYRPKEPGMCQENLYHLTTNVMTTFLRRKVGYPR